MDANSVLGTKPYGTTSMFKGWPATSGLPPLSRWHFTVGGLVLVYCLLVLLYLADLTHFDWTGWYLAQGLAHLQCVGSKDPPRPPYFARAYALPDGTLAATVMCPPCDCAVGSVTLGGQELRFLGRWRSGEKMEPKWDGYHELWVYHWEANTQIRNGDALKMAGGNLTVPVIQRSPRPGVEMCGVIYSPLDPEHLKWLGVWKQHYRAMGVDRFMFYSAHKQYLLQDHVEDISWMPDFYEATGAPVHRAEHGLQQWAMQQCLYEAKAAGVDWLLVMDVDEFLNLGTAPSLPALFSSSGDVDGLTFGSVIYDIGRCLPVNQSMPTFDTRRFGCRASTPDCSWDGLANYIPFRDLVNSCLGPRGRRKYAVRPDRLRLLMVHTVLSSNVRHFQTTDGSPIIKHYQGLISPNLPCYEDLPTTCDAEAWRRCEEYHRDALCMEAPPPAKTTLASGLQTEVGELAGDPRGSHARNSHARKARRQMDLSP